MSVGTVAGNGVSCRIASACEALQWDSLIADFNDASYEQTAVFARRLPRSARQSRFIVERQGAVAACAAVSEVTLPGLGQGLAYVKFGPLWRRRGSAPDFNLYRLSLELLRSEYCGRRGHLLSVLPRPSSEFTSVEEGILREAGFAVRRPIHDANRYLVRVVLDEAAQMASLGQKWRYNLRRALTEELAIAVARSAEAFARFSRLHATMVARKQVSAADPVHLVPAMMSGLPAAMAPVVVLASRGEEALAGAVIGIAGDTAYYLFGATSDEALPIRAGYALHWGILRWLREKRVGWYDLGGEVGDDGLRQFKSGLTGKSGNVVKLSGEFDAWTRGYGRRAAELVFALRDLKGRFAGLFQR